MTRLGLHPSIQPEPNINHYCGGGCKYYYIPLFKESTLDANTLIALGLCNPHERSLIQLKSSLIKAKNGNYSHVKFPVDRISDRIEEALELAQTMPIKVILQGFISLLESDKYFSWMKEKSSQFEVEWVLDKFSEESLAKIHDIAGDSHYSIIVDLNTDWSFLGECDLSRVDQKIHLYFPYQSHKRPQFLTCRQAHQILKVLRSHYPEVTFLPPKGVDLWDDRAHPLMDMEPFIEPCFATDSERPQVRFSVIIPTYNNQNHLRVVLNHLYRQTVGLDQFEIIIVDDGSTDQTQELVLNHIRNFSKRCNLKYIYFPRSQQRTMGDGQYRAGISRNLGVKNAVGDILCFLDSDIVVPPQYLQSVDGALEHSDAIQARRVNLSQAASHLELKYSQIDSQKDLIKDEHYWEEFNKISDWHSIPYNWKYVCTHSFSIKKELFWKVGGLKRNFIFYGFEDTDLGYRLVKMGFKLHLLDLRVYHLFHEDNRSEFRNLKSYRHILLSRTAQIFYLHHLDDGIFENLQSFMQPELSFKQVRDKFFRYSSFYWIWGPRPRVLKSLRPPKSSQHLSVSTPC